MNAAAPRRLPLVRAECENGPRPCPHERCRHHLDSPFASCSLDVAERGPVSTRELAKVLGVTKTRIEQIERSAIEKATRKNKISRFDLGGFAHHRQGEHMIDEDTRDSRHENVKTHVCVSCHESFMSPDRNEAQRLFCGGCL